MPARIIVSIGVLLLCEGALAQSVPPAKPEPVRPKETRALADQFRALPPEFSADLLLKLAGSQQIPEAKWKRELIEDAFLAGSHAPLPYQKSAGGHAVDSRINQENARNGLAALTLQVRAVESMLSINPVRALAMFQEIQFPVLPKVPCDDPATPVLDDYYVLIPKLFAEGFTPKQKQREEDIPFLEERIFAMQSPAQVPPIVHMVLSMPVNPATRKRLLTAFAGSLERVRESNREYVDSAFSNVSFRGNAEMAILLTAMRAYIVRQMSGIRCSDRMTGGKLPQSVAQFNTVAELMVRTDPSAAWLKPISAEEAKPAKDGGTYEKQFSWSSERSKQVLADLKWLKQAPDRTSPEWMELVSALLKRIEGWKEDEEASPADYFFNVAVTYSSLVSTAPPGPARASLMGRFLNFLENRYSVTGNRNLWFARVADLLNEARSLKDPAERAWYLEHLLRSSNPVIASYARLDSLPTNGASTPVQ